MAVTRARKVEQVERLGKNLQSVSTVIVTTYSKLTVAQDYDLRKLLRGSGAKYAVVKNTLVERAANVLGHDGPKREPKSPDAATNVTPWWPAGVVKYWS